MNLYSDQGLLTGAAQASSTKSWVRALERTAEIPKHPARTLAAIIEERAALFGENPALLSDRCCLTFRNLTEQANRYARWGLAQGLVKGDRICLLMLNRPEFLSAWLGLGRVGVVSALLNTNLIGRALAHCIDVVEPKHLIVDGELIGAFLSARPYLKASAQISVLGRSSEFLNLDRELEKHDSSKLGEPEARPVTINDDALLIYTSGTTGLPKAAKVSHYKIVYWSHWFAGMMNVRGEDRMYNCLPMYHSVGGVVAIGAMLVAGASAVVKDRFSARQFWSDIERWECTIFQYIGELCRYLLRAPVSSAESGHKIRLCCGNGLRPDVWAQFQSRFRIAQILEFYASTEGNVSIFNCEGKPGSIGRIPPFLAHRFPAKVVAFDFASQLPLRNEAGRCVQCGVNEVGEMIGKIADDGSVGSFRFEGYTSREETEKKIVRHAFQPGDAWFRTGDLMRADEKGFLYFVDRIGDTFRWKGENVATLEVSEAITSFAGVLEANVYGVRVPGAEGRAGMAALVVGPEFDVGGLWAHLCDQLPEYACPLFLRICSAIETTSTFKHKKNDLADQGYDPAIVEDPLYVNDRSLRSFVPLDRSVYERIQGGEIRL